VSGADAAADSGAADSMAADGGGDAGTLDAGPPHITPAQATIGARRWLKLAADQPVTWSVEETAGGDVDASGLYHAPALLGTVHVVATNARNESARAAVTVRPLTLDLVAGQLDYPGNVDGTGPRAYFGGYLTLGYDSYESRVLAMDPFEAGLLRSVQPDSGEVGTLLGARGDARAVDGDNASARLRGVAAVCSFRHTLLVADVNAIRETPGGGAHPSLSTLAGVAAEPGFVDGDFGAARFRGITSISQEAGTSAVVYVVDSGNAAIRAVDLAASTVSTLAGGTFGSALDGIGTAARFYQPYKLAFDGDHTLYVAEFGGSIRTVDVGTREVKTLVPNLYLISGVALDGRGHLYFGFGNSVKVVDLGSGAVSTFVGGKPYAASVVSPILDGVGADANFTNARDVVFDGAGSLYVGDWATVRKVDIATATVTTVAGSVSCQFMPCQKGPVLYNPGGVTFADAQTLFVTDGGATPGYMTGAEGLLRVDLASGAVTRAYGFSTLSSADHGRGVVRTADGLLYVAGIGTLTVYDPAADKALPVALTTDQVQGFDPEGMVLDRDGSLLVANGSRGNLLRVTFTGTKDQFGRPLIDWQEVVSGLIHPTGLAVDDSGNLFVTDDRAVFEVPAGANTPSLLAGTPGSAGYADGPATAALFGSTNGIALDGHGSLFVADTQNGMIRRVDLTTGMVSTELGVLHERGVQPGHLPATLNQPRQVAVAANGDLVITDEDAVLWLH